MKRVILIILAGVIILCAFVYYGDRFCTKNKPIPNADILIIEGWLPANNLEEIHKTFNFSDYRDIIVTGNDFSTNLSGINMKTYTTKGPVFLGNGAILLKDEMKYLLLKQGSIQSIKVYAKGTNCKGINAHFTLFLNNKILGKAFTFEESREFIFDVDSMPDTLEMFILNFDNDLQIKNEDRNLIIDSIVFGGIQLTRKDFNLARNTYPERCGFGFTSNAEKTYHYFLSLKRNENLHFIAAPVLQRNFTRHCANTCKEWVQRKYPKQNLEINVISADFHSSRTYYTFKKELKKHSIGIISLKSNENISTNRIRNFGRIKSILEEYAGILAALI